MRKAICVPALALVLIAAAGCGSSGNSSSGNKSSNSKATAASGSTTSAAAKGPAIVVGVPVEQSGPVASSLGPALKGAEAWAKSVNANGGIKGHPIKLVATDGKSTPTGNVTATKQAVESDNAVALFPFIGNTSLIAKYVDAKQIPAIGGVGGGDPTYITDPYFFPAGTTVQWFAMANVQGATTAGKKKIGYMTCSEVVQCTQSIPLVQQAIKALGAQLVYKAQISATQPDYTSECLAAKNAGAAAIINSTPTSTLARVAPACSSQGFSPQMVISQQQITGGLSSIKALDGAVVAYLLLPTFATRSPAIKEFFAAMDKYYPGYSKSKDFGQITLQGWAAGKLLEAALANITPTQKVTSQDIINGLYALKGETLNGLSAPMTFVKGKPRSTPCAFYGQYQNGKLVPWKGNLDPVCPPANLTK